MALIACRECASEISDSAQTCPRCGVSGPAGMTYIYVRRATGIVGMTSKVHVYVDGNFRGEVGPGAWIVAEVSPGTHEVRLATTSGGRGVVESVTVRRDLVATFDVSISALGGGFTGSLAAGGSVSARLSYAPPVRPAS